MCLRALRFVPCSRADAARRQGGLRRWNEGDSIAINTGWNVLEAMVCSYMPYLAD